MNRLKLAVFLSTAIFSGSVFADANITHPNLKEAYQHCNESIRNVTVAQQNNANNGAFGGHAQKAKQLLQQAKNEIELAEQFRNAHAHAQPNNGNARQENPRVELIIRP